MLPVLTGKVAIGSTLTGTSGTWNPAATHFDYYFLRCDINGANCTLIAGHPRSSNKYTITSDDAGYTLQMQVVAANADGYRSAWTLLTAVVR